jgi:hypothetical protein
MAETWSVDPKRSILRRKTAEQSLKMLMAQQDL